MPLRSGLPAVVRVLGASVTTWMHRCCRKRTGRLATSRSVEQLPAASLQHRWQEQLRERIALLLRQRARLKADEAPVVLLLPQANAIPWSSTVDSPRGPECVRRWPALRLSTP
jgi:hypothetical protein